MVKKGFSKWWIVILLLVVGGVVWGWSQFGQTVKDRYYLTFENKPYELPEGASVSGEVKKVATVEERVQGYKNPGSKVILPGAKWVPQSFNNCGPATVSMMLQYFGHDVPQTVTKAALRTSPNDTNVFTYEIKDYLKSEFNLESKHMYNGDIQLMKTLLANGFYIMVEDWLHPNEDVGHDTIIRGYDDEKGVFISDDSYIGVNITYKYKEWDEQQWKPFNREFLPVYRKEQEPVLKAILADNWDEKKMYENSVARNGIDVGKNQSDMYAWFNLGTSYYALGRYGEAKMAFEKSKALGWPRRMLWYQYQPIQTYNKLGEYQKALELIAQGLTGNDSFAELHYEAAIAYKGLGNLAKAREEVDKALSFHPRLQPAIEFKRTL